jgi:ParB family transcriptional regulator, chromosome partitioning protein
MNRGNKGFGDLLAADLDAPNSEVEKIKPADSIIASRTDALARIASGKVVTDRTEFVDPVRCKPWRLHNRDLDHLNEESCRDLIDAFLSAKKQRIPAIVRRVAGDPDHDYEIIAGVRRWWTAKWLRENNHPEFDYLVTVQKLTDEEAFRVSDVENRSRKDITDWERAREYTRALAEFYDGSQSRMAEHLNISKSWLSRLIDVARLPEEIVAAFADRHDITVRVARDIKPLMSDRKALLRMIAEGMRIREERDESDKTLSGPETAKRLLAAGREPKPKSKTGKLLTRTDQHGKAVLHYGSAGKGKITLAIDSSSTVPRKTVLDAVESVLVELGVIPAA